ncbi:hypothetical protein NDU88_007235 [Pleurodeles waltl]|uniref:Uncharacterized protein n=1 Tax=Pleurodeles waltl TaxID=8319 RepID=A0AAV7N6E4_PLEWA|nr:hypothetical protein NDU88_007235 [Pleurodeles waltl]
MTAHGDEIVSRNLPRVHGLATDTDGRLILELCSPVGLVQGSGCLGSSGYLRSRPGSSRKRCDMTRWPGPLLRIPISAAAAQVEPS